MKVSIERHPHWACIFLKGDGPAPGVVDADTLRDFRDALEELASTPDLRCLLVEAAACGGASLPALSRVTGDEMLGQATLFAALLQSIHDFRTPVVFWARGHQQGAALGLATASDIILGDRTSAFSLPEATVSMAPILISPWLARRVAPALFRRLALSGAVLDADSALRIGLIDEIYNGPGFPPQLARILKSSPASVRKIKNLSRFTPPPEIVQEFLDFMSNSQVQEDLATIAAEGSPTGRGEGP